LRYWPGWETAPAGVLAAFDLRLGQSHRPQLQRAHGRVPANPFGLRRSELSFYLFGQDESEHDAVDNRDNEEAPEREDPVGLHRRIGKEGQQNHEEHDRDHEFTHVKPCIHVVSSKLLLRAALTLGKVLVVSGGHAHTSSIAGSHGLGTGLLRRELAVIRHQRTLARRFLLLARRGRLPLPDGRSGQSGRRFFHGFERRFTVRVYFSHIKSLQLGALRLPV
jgi:hypothetical protein